MRIPSVSGLNLILETWVRKNGLHLKRGASLHVRLSGKASEC